MSVPATKVVQLETILNMLLTVSDLTDQVRAGTVALQFEVDLISHCEARLWLRPLSSPPALRLPAFPAK